MDEEIKKIINVSVQNVFESRSHNPIVQAVHQSSQKMGLTDFQELCFLSSELIKENQRLKDRILEKEFSTINKIVFCHQCSKIIANSGSQKNDGLQDIEKPDLLGR